MQGFSPLDGQVRFSILEVAVHPSYSNFFLETEQKRLFLCQRLQ
jgi:hypothetical protein